MEIEGDLPPREEKGVRLWEKVRNFFNRKPRETQANPPPHEVLPQSPQPLDPEVRNRIFSRVEAMLRGNPKLVGEGGVLNLPISSEGGIRAEEMADLMAGQESLEFTEAEIGDVVWWRDEKGHPGYFLITEKYKLAPGNWQYGKGAIRVEFDDGKAIEADEASIAGASFGGMIRVMCIAKNIPVEFTIPSGDKYERYFTNPVKEFGLIKAESLK